MRCLVDLRGTPHARVASLLRPLPPTTRVVRRVCVLCPYACACIGFFRVEPVRFLSHRVPSTGAPHLVCVSHTDTRTSAPLRRSYLFRFVIFFSEVACACLSPPPLCVSVTSIVDASRQISRARLRSAFMLHLPSLPVPNPSPHYRHTHIPSSSYM